MPKGPIFRRCKLYLGVGVSVHIVPPPSCVGTTCTDTVPLVPRLTYLCFASMQTGGREVQRARPRYNVTAVVGGTHSRHGIANDRLALSGSAAGANDVLFDCPCAGALFDPQGGPGARQQLCAWHHPGRRGAFLILAWRRAAGPAQGGGTSSPAEPLECASL